MADVVSAVRSYLLGNATVKSKVAQRLYFDRLRQSCALPAATIEKVSESHDHLLGQRSGFVKTRFSIRCYAAKRLDANALAQDMYASGIDAVKGVTHGVDIRGVTVEDGQRNYLVDARDGGDDPDYVTEFDLMVTYRE